MNPRTAGIIIVVVGLVLIVSGLFVTINYVPTVYDGVNGLVLTTPHTVHNYFVTLFGLGVLFFGVMMLLAKQREPVTMFDEENLREGR